MKFEHTDVWGFEHAIRGMRNPKASWDKSDSYRADDGTFVVGPADMALMRKLIKAGSEHRKFMRQIEVSVDISSGLHWWKEFDTYKIGTTANSTSTMHKIATTPITIDMFETDDYKPDLPFSFTDDQKFNLNLFTDYMISVLERLREYCQDEELDEQTRKAYWKELIRWLPCGWLQTRTVTMSYEVLLRICSPGQRRHHKLTEWSKSFIGWARTLPYAQELLFGDELEAKNEPATT